jgi:hypothetical protein
VVCGRLGTYEAALAGNRRNARSTGIDMISTPLESWYAMRTGIVTTPLRDSVRSRPDPLPRRRHDRGRGSSPAAGVLIVVGVGVTVLMSLWPLMVAFSEFAAIGLVAVAVLALGALALDALQAVARRED